MAQGVSTGPPTALLWVLRRKAGGARFIFRKERLIMTQVLRGNIVQAPQLGKLDIREHGYLVLEDGAVQGVYDALPEAFASAPLTDYGDRLIMQSFADMHLHAPSIPCWAWAWTCPCWIG